MTTDRITLTAAFEAEPLRFFAEELTSFMDIIDADNVTDDVEIDSMEDTLLLAITWASCEYLNSPANEPHVQWLTDWLVNEYDAVDDGSVDERTLAPAWHELIDHLLAIRGNAWMDHSRDYSHEDTEGSQAYRSARSYTKCAGISAVLDDAAELAEMAIEVAERLNFPL